MTPDVCRLPGAGAILAAHGPALPQPDQLCGPFAARVALHAVVAEPPSVTDLALASGTSIWPHDVAGWRPVGERLVRTGWDLLPVAASIDDGGTDASGLAAGIAARCSGVGVVAAGGPGDIAALLVALRDLGRPLGVLANLRTGPVAPTGTTWDVGHFVVLWGTCDGQIAVADSYATLGAPGLPPGCRLVAGEALAEALVGRGLLVLAGVDDLVEIRAVVAEYGFLDRFWST